MKPFLRYLFLIAWVPSLVCTHYRPEGLSAAGVNRSVNEELIGCVDTAGFRFMFYNTENLFDADDDPEVSDEEFLPDGERRWSSFRYIRKLNSVARVILSSGEWEPPALIGLCETENSGVIADLLTSTMLSRFNYRSVYYESTDSRGIDVCLLYNSDKVSLLYSEAIYPGRHVDGNTFFKGRPVVYAVVSVSGCRLHIFLNHWPSRRGGVLWGRDIREDFAALVRNRVDSIFLDEGEESAVIIAGDFNCNPSDREVALLSGSGLVNLTAGNMAANSGTYRYRGVWHYFDQIMVSEPMIDGSACIVAGDFRVHAPAFMLYDDPVYPGLKPFPAFDGFRFTGGYSDHLPVIVSIRSKYLACADKLLRTQAY